jgi:hypothetical protein
VTHHDSSEIAPTVFNFVRDYAIDVIEAAKKQSVPAVPLGPLTVFVENLFAQFFRAALNVTITGFSDASHEKAARERIRLEKNDGKAETIAMISSYETYCRIYPDIAQDRSVPDDAEVLDEIRSTLLESFLPELLNRIEAWAEANDKKPIIGASKRARGHLESATSELYG